MAITTRLVGTACPVTVAGQNVTFAGWDLDWEWYSDIVLDTWVVYNVTRSASLVIHAKSGTEAGGYTLELTGDASAWQTGDLCVVSNSATFAVHATIAALLAAGAAYDTAILCYASTTYLPNYNAGFAQGIKPMYTYGHLSRQRCSLNGITLSGDNSSNTTQVTWRNVTTFTNTQGFLHHDTGAGKTGGGVKIRRCVGIGATANSPVFWFRGQGANVCQVEFCLATTALYGFYHDLTVGGVKFYHCTARKCTTGFLNNSNSSTYQNCVSLDGGTDFASKTNGTYTACASGDATGTAGLTAMLLSAAKFWGDNANGFRSAEGRILTTSALFDAGTYSASYQKDIDGNAITDGHAPIGCHVGTAAPYGLTEPTAAQLEDGISIIQFSGTITGTLEAEAHTADEVLDTAAVDPGNVHLPDAAEVEDGVMFGPNSATEGTLVAGGGTPVLGGHFTRRA